MIDNLEYKNRLNHWNANEKYLSEVRFLYSLLNLKKTDVVLDFGCGTGFCLEYLNEFSGAKVYGYDVNILFEEEDNKGWFVPDYSKHSYSKIYMMHSIAHIPNITKVLTKLHGLLDENGELVIITPNRDYDDYFKRFSDSNYTPDSTVIRHFNMSELLGILRDSGFTINVAGQFGTFVSTFNERIFAVAWKG